MVKITMTGVEKKSPEGKAPYWLYTDSLGNKHTAWEEDLADKIVIGSPMNLILKVSGNYSNVRGIDLNPLISDGTTNQDPISTTKQSNVIKNDLKSTPKASATPRSASAITATELLRYAVKLTAESKDSLDFNTSCELVKNAFDDFRNHLE